MPLFPEREPRLPVEVQPESPEIPEQIEKAGVNVRPTQFTAQVKNAAGQNLLRTPATQVITLQIPAGQQTLASWSKGSITSSLTWLAAFWLRMIKKAIYFGWRIISSSKLKAQSSNP